MQTQTQSNQLNIHPIIAKIIESRGFSRKDIASFLSKNLNKLPDLTQLKDLEKASKRIINAIEQNGSLGVYGDYDVDGCTSCALLYHFFQMIDVDVQLFQPSRFVEGYGIHPCSIDNAIEKKINVLISVDCGITNNETADYAKKVGVDLIITDHHKDASEQMPKAYAVVNPNRRDEPVDGPLKSLAGVGVAFCLALKIKLDLEKKGRSIPSLYPLLQFVAIGTICDMAKLDLVNLKLVRHGLLQMPKSRFKGILQFIPNQERTLNCLPSEKVSFHIGPHINSKGRLDHPEAALNLLISNDSAEAYSYFAQLEISNRERKFIQHNVFEQARAQIIDSFDNENPVISIAYQEDWHEGVIGIVASKLVETFKVPAMVFTQVEAENGKKMLKASARSAGELDLFECLNQCDFLFEKFGGHKAAAGLSMTLENFEPFKQKINQIIRQFPLIQRTVQNEFDLEIKPSDITPGLLKQLELLEPFGQANPRPKFLIKDIKLESYQILKEVHVKWNFCDTKNPNIKLKGISFNFVGQWGKIPPQEIFERQQQEQLNILFGLSINRFNGNEYIQLMMDDLYF